MAVPSSGNSISLAGLAAEKDIDDYTDADYDDVLSLKDLTIGGNANGNSFVAEATNGFSASKPDNVAPYRMSEFYSYDHDASSPACNLAYHDGGQGTFNYPINLGSATGIVTIEYEAYNKPDKFVFTWNGNTYTSGSGNGTGAGFVGSQSYLSSLQATAGNSSATITTLSNTTSKGRGTITFNKTTSSSTSSMQVSAPLSGTAWWFSVSCPGQQVIGGGSGVAPTVTTSGESSITSSGFTMNGNVSSKGLTSNFTTTGTVSARGFVYKSGNVTTSFVSGDTGVTLDQADTTNSTGNFSEAVTGLSASSTYTYRAYATNAAGTTYGANEQVTTTSAITSFSSSLSGRTTDVCGFATNQTYYHNGSGSYPVVNDVVYSNSGGTTFLAVGFRKLGSGLKYRVDQNGVVGAITLC
jgi:hypothetical protein